MIIAQDMVNKLIWPKIAQYFRDRVGFAVYAIAVKEIVFCKRYLDAKHLSIRRAVNNKDAAKLQWIENWPACFNDALSEHAKCDIGFYCMQCTVYW